RVLGKSGGLGGPRVILRGPSVFGVTPLPSPDDQGKVRDPQLVRLFLATHPWYLPQAEIPSGGLLSLWGPSLSPPLSPPPRYWIRAFPRELSGDPQVLGRLRELGTALGGGP
ncbi:GRP2 protein, partial [Xiphorhynchus elegans]|nr:GRP2 protein [Xiphorhynchus elegans]